MILITGDIHGDISRFSDKKIRKLKKGDCLIVCGDFGFVWDGSDKEKKLLKKLGKRRYNILFVEGAHDNLDELEKYPTEMWNGGLTRVISGNLRQLVRGNIFDIGGKRVFAFGGGRGEENGGAAPCSEETASRYECPSEAEITGSDARLAAVSKTVDMIVSYEPPASIADFLGYGVTAADGVGVYLDTVRHEIRFGIWYFGKHHINKTVPPRFMAVFDSVTDAEVLK
ncbi:MAG: metallophosphoesterase [Ruminiclostridium sp.]|nr:metallophosphoesterase [Ruminiclostridium sp.]